MIVSRTLLATAGLALALTAGAASFDDLLAGFGSSGAAQVKAYTQPLGDAATALATGGAFHGARSKGIAGFDLGIKVLLLPVSSGDAPAGSILASSQTDVSTLGLPMLTASKGLVKGLQVSGRYMGLELSKDVGKLSYMGASLRFELNELFHVPLLMPRIGLQADWNKLEVGESLSTTATSLDLIVSKSFVIIEPYAGLSLAKGTTDISYTSTALPGQQVGVSLDSKPLRLAAGVSVTPFPLLRINAEVAKGDFTTATLGVLINLF